MSVAGCRAMQVHDLDGTSYQNEKRSFYIPEKEAQVKLKSYAYRWKSGELSGVCSQRPINVLDGFDVDLTNQALSLQSISIDTIELETAALFELDSTELSKTGEVLLQDSVERLQKYDTLLHVKINGHTDSQGSHSYNLALSQSRADKIASILKETLGSVSLGMKAHGELTPIASNAIADQRKKNRRVSLSAYVSSHRDSNIDNTLCTATINSDQSESSAELSLASLSKRVASSLLNPYTDRPPLSIGDRIRLLIPEGDEISGIYEVSLGGGIEIPFLGFVSAHGLDTKQLEQTIADRLVKQQIFRIDTVHVSATVQEWAPIDVLVSGATFDPGRVTINRQKVELRNFKQTQMSGDYAKDRLLSTV